MYKFFKKIFQNTIMLIFLTNLFIALFISKFMAIPTSMAIMIILTGIVFIPHITRELVKEISHEKNIIF